MAASRPAAQPLSLERARRAAADENGAATPEMLRQAFFERGPPIFLADLDGRICVASDSCRELLRAVADRLGVEPAELAAIPQPRDEAEPDVSPSDGIDLAGFPSRRLTLNRGLLRDSRGTPIGVFGLFEENDEQVRLAQELSIVRERLDDITRLVSDWVWETDAEMVLSAVSPRIGEMLDYHPRELIGRSFADLGSFPDGTPPFVRADSGPQHPPFRDIAYRIRRRDGGDRLLRLSGLPVFSSTSGEFLGYRGTARDVTQEIEAWERVAQSRGRLVEAIESISEGFALFDRDERLVLCNRKYRSMFPASAELLEPGIAFADFIRATAERGGIMLGDDTAESWCARQRELRRTGTASFELQLGDGRWVKVGDRVAGDGSTVGILTDITELKRREEALSSAKEFAEIANRSKSEFLANISHELRTPLNAIIGFTEIMREEIFGPVGSRQYRDYLGDILDSARHLLDVINDILDIAKAEAGKLELDEEEVEITTVIRAATRLVQDRAHRTELTIAINAPAGLPQLYADERKLKQILLNLLTNAIKFTPPGGHIEVGARIDEGGDFLLQVADTGIGIAPEDVATALTPFGQVDGSLNRKYEGTGLGLPLCRAMVELHGGILSIASQVDEGTTVTMRLPAARVRQDFDYGT
ncbi:MAG: PAS-domain containing protein [Alphaproteobacteria bacterium]|nr:PAS-domain containing protein [Alphaproteobacteria bacterium]